MKNEKKKVIQTANSFGVIYCQEDVNRVMVEMFFILQQKEKKKLAA